MIHLLKSKIHHASVTSKDIDYIGSIFIDKKLLDLCNIVEYEKVDVINVENWSRWQTYVWFAEEWSGEILVNWWWAHLCSVWDRLIILAYQIVDKLEEKPKMIFVDKANKFTKYL